MTAQKAIAYTLGEECPMALDIKHGSCPFEHDTDAHDRDGTLDASPGSDKSDVN